MANAIRAATAAVACAWSCEQPAAALCCIVLQCACPVCNLETVRHTFWGHGGMADLQAPDRSTCCNRCCYKQQHHRDLNRALHGCHCFQHVNLQQEKTLLQGATLLRSWPRWFTLQVTCVKGIGTPAVDEGHPKAGVRSSIRVHVLRTSLSTESVIWHETLHQNVNKRRHARPPQRVWTA